MFSLDLSHQAKDFLNRLDPKQFRQVVRKVFSLLENPKPADARQLKGQLYWRADMGEHRIIYKIEHNTLKIVLVDKRNDDEVYKKLERL